MNNTWDCRHFTIGKHNYVPQFPFFKEVSGCLKNMAEQYISEANENVDTNISEDLRFEPSGKLTCLTSYIYSTSILKL